MTAVRTSVLPPYAAHLRVYEPLGAYPEAERSRWQVYASRLEPEQGDPGALAGAVLEEQRAALAELLASTPRALPERESEQAFVRVLDGITYVCPWTTRLRSWQALDELRESMPEFLLDTVLPPAVRAEAVARREGWRRDHPDARPWILTSRWEVPVGWFLPFAEEDRLLVPAGPAESPTPAALFYLTPMVEARRRVARGYRALRTGVSAAASKRSGGSLVRAVEQVGRWLEEFHPRSLVELDYGGLVHLLGPEGLAAERSVGEVGRGLSALRAGDGEEALRVYEAVTARWRRVAERRRAS